MPTHRNDRFSALRLPSEQAAAVKALAAKTGCTVSEIHRRALASFLAAAELAAEPPTRRPRAERSANHAT